MRARQVARWLGTAFCVAGAGFALAAAKVAPNASIQQIMIHQIDPAADTLWGSVGIEETSKGTRQRAPRNVAQWDKLRGEAQKLVAGAQALKSPHLPVGGKTHGLLADANTPGIRSTDQISADIDRDPARFLAAADRLQRAGNEALLAIAARNPGRLIHAGAAMDAACEACHAAYWYPRQRLILPSADAFRRKAIRP